MAETSHGWLFLSNHGTVLLSVAGDPTVSISEIAQLLGVDERAVREVLEDLLAEGYVVRRREGRLDRYEINRAAHLRHPLFEDVEIGPLIDALQRERRL
jgi:DNA-binding transcriptional ArsR family regulator